MGKGEIEQQREQQQQQKQQQQQQQQQEAQQEPICWRFCRNCVDAFGSFAFPFGRCKLDALGKGVSPLQFPVPEAHDAVSLATSL